MAYIVKSYDSADTVAVEATRDCLALLKASEPGRPFTIALSGGRSIQGFFRELVARAKAESADTSRLVFCWADERCVPPEDPDSNYKMANEQLFQPLGVREDQIVRIAGELDPGEAAAAAQKELREKVGKIDPDSDQPVIDLVILGTGEDGHVASLFPCASEEVIASSETFIPVIGPKPPPQRVSLTYAAINAAANVWVLVLGEGKAEALKIATSSDPSNPLGRVMQTCRRAEVYTDLEVTL